MHFWVSYIFFNIEFRIRKNFPSRERGELPEVGKIVNKESIFVVGVGQHFQRNKEYDKSLEV